MPKHSGKSKGMGGHKPKGMGGHKPKGMGSHYGMGHSAVEIGGHVGGPVRGLGGHKPRGMGQHSNPLRLFELNPAGGALAPVPPPFVMPRGADPRIDPRMRRPRGMAFEHGAPETRVAQGALAATVGSLNPAFGVLVAADPLGWF